MKKKILFVSLVIFQISVNHINSQNIISVNDVDNIDIYMSVKVEPPLRYEERTAEAVKNDYNVFMNIKSKKVTDHLENMVNTINSLQDSVSNFPLKSTTTKFVIDFKKDSVVKCTIGICTGDLIVLNNGADGKVYEKRKAFDDFLKFIFTDEFLDYAKTGALLKF